MSTRVGFGDGGPRYTVLAKYFEDKYGNRAALGHTPWRAFSHSSEFKRKPGNISMVPWLNNSY